MRPTFSPKRPLWLCIVLCLIAPIHISAHETLTALLACDTLSDLSSSVKKDMGSLKTLLKTVSHYTGIHVKTEELTGDGLSANSVWEWVARVKKSPPEIVLIYYSGHGYRTDATSSSWPLLFFSKNRESLDSQTLWNDLRGTGPRLVIILLDCCNCPPLQTSLGTQRICHRTRHVDKKRPGLKTLFLKTQGSVVAVGASPGESAFALDTGSLFTTSLAQAIRSSTRTKNISWSTIFEQTAVLCGHMQRPLCLVQTSPWVLKSCRR
jgi:hypothetical protein